MSPMDQIKTGLRSLVQGMAALRSWVRLRGLLARFLLMFYLVTMASVAVVGYYGYSSASSAYRSKATELVAGYTAETASKMETFQELPQSDLTYFGAYHPLLNALYWQDLRDGGKAAYWRSLTLEAMQQYASSNPYEYRLRFIDTDGNERMGVRRDLQTGRVQVIADGDLQNRKDEGYFVQGMKLAKGGHYAGALMLNTENGQVEMPRVPVIHFVTPVIGANNVRYGVLEVVVLADYYFRFARDANKVDASRRFFLINNDGDYLFHADKDMTFGGAQAHGANFETDFPGVLAEVGALEGQQTQAIHGRIMSFRHIHPNPGRHENGFILVGMVEESVALAELNAFVRMFIVLVVLVAVVVLVAARSYVGGLVGPLAFATRQLQRLGQGETSRDEIAYRANDEIQDILTVTGTLMANMEQLAAQADVIAQGDFSCEVPLLSERDRLGGAINNMTHMLREARQLDLRSNWLKDGLSQLSQALTGDPTPQQLADTAISLVGRTLEAGRGVFYRYLEDERTLELLGSYMFTEREALGNRFRLGEGAVGQVAMERKPIILHATDGIPVVTGTLSLPPLHIYTYPLLREDKLLGVIELASFERFDDLKQEFITRAADVVASFLSGNQQRERIKGLLKVAEDATRQAQEQSRRLQAANTMMEEQQQQLQQQTEELQSSNAQMEEQQQQLQQQTEELQSSNAQMEEQQQQLQLQTKELEAKNRDLNQSRDELNRRAQDLEQASRYKSEFLANMSHELRTPLNSIILLSKMLALNEDKHLTAEEAKRATIVHHAGEELLRLINDILDLSKIESGRMELHLQTIATQGLAADFHDLFAATAHDKGLEFTLEDRLHGEFVSDRDKVSQVVRNLLANAFKFTKTGSVTLCIKASGRSDLPLCIMVNDTGIGIPEDKQSLVFNAFQQVDGSISREFGGTGLGLSISLRFAELLGGTIELRSTPGEGSEFSLLLPMAPEHYPEAAAAVIADHAPPPTAPVVRPALQVHDDRTTLKSSDKVILVIDDDPGFGGALLALNKRLGYKTLVATSGQEGLRMAKAYRPRGILLDLGLPDMDGGEVLHLLKLDRALRRLPVYIVSARDKDEMMLREEISGYLCKPVNESQLEKAEAEVLALADREINRLLLVDGDAMPRDKLEEIVRPDGMAVRTVPSIAAALDALGSDSWQLAVVNLAKGDDGVATCRALRRAAPEMELILFSDTPLSPEDEAALRPFTDSLFVKSVHADQRLLENIERFLKDMAPAGGGLAAEAVPMAGDGVKKLDGRRILVVDDDPRNLFVIASALEQHGAKVTSALNARKGLELLRQNGADLVFMDIMMPEIDGYEAIRQIRSEPPAIARIPVIALTAKALMADREKAMAAGANDYLSKPVDYELLINMAKVWCEEAP